jgi:hypothetical protein
VDEEGIPKKILNNNKKPLKIKAEIMMGKKLPGA